MPPSGQSRVQHGWLMNRIPGELQAANIAQATTHNLISWCAALCEATSGHTRHWLAAEGNTRAGWSQPWYATSVQWMTPAKQTRSPTDWQICEQNMRGIVLLGPTKILRESPSTRVKAKHFIASISQRYTSNRSKATLKRTSNLGQS